MCELRTAKLLMSFHGCDLCVFDELQAASLLSWLSWLHYSTLQYVSFPSSLMLAAVS
jgi:hypothetical protein